MPPIHKVLIANRGEIAVRIMHTCRSMGLRTVAVFSDADATALHVASADEAVHIGASPASESYLRIDAIIEAAKRTQADAIHPGYGFLSENAEFSQRCRDEGIVFIGPAPDTIAAMGSKIHAKRLLQEREAGAIPVIPGYNGDDQSIETLTTKALEVGFPVLLKASAGGGGKGMRVVRDRATLRESVESAQTESRNAFGDDALLIERYFDNVKHVEIQIVGDTHGNVTHLFERECSVQRRHQKVIEETPCVVLAPAVRQRMVEAAIRIGKAISYVGLGTVEFILDCSNMRDFYFLEVNTRLQVEHPVTEAVTGLDLVQIQIEIAQGKSILADLHLDQATTEGHAIECRVYAEDPANNFFPCTGTLLLWEQAKLPPSLVRFDTGIVSGSTISVFYDPLISKIIAYGATRAEAIAHLQAALAQTVTLGLVTNKQFLNLILSHEVFRDGSFNTHFIDNHLAQDERLGSNAVSAELADELALVASLWLWRENENKRTLLQHVPSGWRNNRYAAQRRSFAIKGRDEPVSIEYVHNAGTHKHRQHKYQAEVRQVLEQQQQQHTPGLHVPSSARVSHSPGELFDFRLTNGRQVRVVLCAVDHCSISVSIDGHRKEYVVATSPTAPDALYVHIRGSSDGAEYSLQRVSRFASADADDGSGEIPYVSQMPARILDVVRLDGEQVAEGETVIVMESMKMESKIAALKAGTVRIYVRKGDLVEAGTQLFNVE